MAGGIDPFIIWNFLFFFVSMYSDFKILSLCTYRASGSIGQRASSLVKIQAVACSRKCPLLLPLRTYPVSTYEVPHPMSGGWADEESPFL